MFSLQREPRAQDDVTYEDGDGADRHQSAGSALGGPKAPSPSAKQEDGSLNFASSPSRGPSSDHQNSPKMPETAFDQEPEGPEQADDHEDFAEEAHFWRNQEQQYRRGPEWTP